MKPQASRHSSRTCPSFRSKTSTDSMVSETSCPYAPTFCTGVPPTLPGMPLRHSTPAHCAMTACETKRSQDSPAPTSNRILAFVIVSGPALDAGDRHLQDQSGPATIRHEQVAAASQNKERGFRLREGDRLLHFAGR